MIGASGFTLLAEAAIHGFRLIEGWGDHGPLPDPAVDARR
jgi:hypothetical protein